MTTEQPEAPMSVADIALAEFERLNAEIERLTAERDALKDDAKRGRFMIDNGCWHRGEEQTHLAVLVPQGSDLSCYAMRQRAIDAAIRAHLPAVARMVTDFPALQQFHTKHALGPMAAPSCLCCGQYTHPIVRPVAVKHAELPGIVICKRCKDASTTPPAASEQAPVQLTYPEDCHARGLCMQNNPGHICGCNIKAHQPPAPQAAQEPVAWLVYAEKFASGRQLVFTKPENLSSYVKAKALYETPFLTPQIRYDYLSEYADKHRLHFNTLCEVVRESVTAITTQAQPVNQQLLEALPENPKNLRDYPSRATTAGYRLGFEDGYKVARIAAIAAAEKGGQS